MVMDTERRSSHGQVLPRERRSLFERWPGFLIVIGLGRGAEAECWAAGRNTATLILRCPAGASKDEGFGLQGRSARRMLRGFALRPKHLSMRAVGEVALSNTGPTRNATM
ncbi:hypothetical protein A6R70_22830 [Agrobacterium rubi]|nr:hypothetical protein [Agrobacterium rubi]